MAVTKRVPAVEGLFAETKDGPRLLGSRCASCGTPYFPKSPVCHRPDCRGKSMQEATFGPRGKIWSLAIQYYPPPPPAKHDEPFVPYALGMVDMEDGLRVLARFSTDDPEGLKVGQEVELVLEKLYTDEEGNEVIVWKFKPV